MSERQVTVQGGSSVRLRVAGKYCDRNIVVTAEGGDGGVELPDLTNPGGAKHLREGYQMIDENGNAVDGSLPDVTPTVSIDVEGGLIAATATIPKEGVVAEGGTKETLQLPTPEAATPSLELNVDEATVVAMVSQEPGYIEEASTKTATLELPAYYGAYIIPGAVNQEAGGRGQFMMSPVVVRGDEYLVPENIAAGVSIFGVEGTHEGGVTLPTLENPATEAEVFEGYEYINGAGTKKTGTFTVEEEVAELEALAAALKESLEGKIATGGGSGGDPSLPAGYFRADYIKFTGKQAVDTGIVCTQNTKIRMLFTRDSDESMYMYGVVNSDNTASVTAYMTSSGGSWRFGNKYSAKDIVANEELVQTAIVDKTGFIRADDTASISGVNDFETIGSLTIGAVRNANGTVADAQFIGKMLLFEMWDGSAEALRLVPLVNAEGMYRFYDAVSKEFFDSITDTALEGGNL